MMVRLLNSKLITLHRGMTRGLSECRICTECDGWVYTLTQVCQWNTCDWRILHGDPCMTREWHERHEDDTDLLPIQHLRRQKRETMALTKSHKQNKAEPELYEDFEGHYFTFLQILLARLWQVIGEEDKNVFGKGGDGMIMVISMTMMMATWYMMMIVTMVTKTMMMATWYMMMITMMVNR